MWECMAEHTGSPANVYYDVRWTRKGFQWRGFWAFLLGLIMEGAFAGDFRRNIIEIVRSDGTIAYRLDYGFESAGEASSQIKADLEKMTREQFEQEWITQA